MKSPRSIFILSIFMLAAGLALTPASAQKKNAKAAKPAASKPTPTPMPSPLPTPTPAPTPAPVQVERLEVMATPSQIAIAAMGGGIEQRNVVITANGPVEGINFIPIDLGRSDDRGIVIPATAVAVGPTHHQLSGADDSVVVPLTFDLRGARSGEFNGVVLVQYKGGKLTIPVTVTIKDPWALPLAMLALGLGLSVVVTHFRENGRSRDETSRRSGLVRTQLQAEPEMDEIFRKRLEGLLADCNTSLAAEKWDEAEKSVELAEAVVGKWHRGHSDWRPQLQYRQELLNWMKELGDPADLPPYLVIVHRNLEEAGYTAPNLSGPDKLQEKLETLVQQLNRYTQIHNQIQTLDWMIDLLEEQQAEWREKLVAWRHSLDHLPTEDAGAAEALRGEVEAGITAVQTLIAQGSPSKSSYSNSFNPGRELPPLSAAPPAKLSEDEQNEKTDLRLKWVRRSTYLLAVVLLAGAGFAELYVTQPTFGATRWSDYFTLLAWGFGVEATRASVIGLMKNWGLPGIK
ncbi:MAG TPA: hypothetical protein VJ302_35430 [Blastocatellia bacterium]|nr:hypothetical protein [Blastocatellia bacterium]